jgi:Ca2+-binding RTX toxin-like protein
MVAGITGFEAMTFTTAAATPNITTVDANVASGVTFTVTGSNLTGALTFNGSAETNGTFNIAGGTGADILTGGEGVDTISASAGDDTITGGLAADVLTGGIGADVFTYTAVAESSGANIDSVTDWTSATDKLSITLNYGTNTSAGIVVNTNRATTTAITSQAAAQDALTGDRGQWVYDTSTSQLYVNTNSDNLITATDYRIGLNAGATAGNTVVNGDINFVITGGSGADSITGGNGADTISGGAGNNVYYYNGSDAPTGESITGGANTDTLVLNASTSFVAATFGAAGTVLTSASINNIVISTGTIGTFTGAQLTGQAININSTAVGAASLVITGSNALADFTTLAFTVSGGADAFDTGVDTVTINIGSVTGVSTTGTTLADNIVGSAQGESILGGTGNDTINGAAGIDIITGGAGGDIMTGGTGDTVDTFILTRTSSIATSASDVTLGVSNTVVDNLDTFTYGNGVDTITDFGLTGTGLLGVDLFDVSVIGTTYINLSGTTAATALAAGSHYYLQGTYTGGVFTANSAATATTANVALLIVADGIADTLANQTGVVILTGVNAIAANFTTATFI